MRCSMWRRDTSFRFFLALVGWQASAASADSQVFFASFTWRLSLITYNLRLGIWEDSNSRTKTLLCFRWSCLCRLCTCPSHDSLQGSRENVKVFEYQPHQAQPPTNRITKARCVLVWRRLFKAVCFCVREGSFASGTFLPIWCNPYAWAWISPNSSDYPKTAYQRKNTKG